MREWIDEPEEPDDDRETLAVCEWCDNDIKRESNRLYGDPYYNINGCCIHEECVYEWLKQFKHGG